MVGRQTEVPHHQETEEQQQQEAPLEASQWHPTRKGGALGPLEPLSSPWATTLGAPFNLSSLWSSSWFIPSEPKTFCFTHRTFISKKQSKMTLGICTEKQRLSDWLKIVPYTAYKSHTCRISGETKAVAEVFCFPYSMLSSKDLPWTTLSRLGKGKTLPIWSLQTPYLPYLWWGSWLSRRPEPLGAYYYLLTDVCLPVWHVCWTQHLPLLYQIHWCMY